MRHVSKRAWRRVTDICSAEPLVRVIGILRVRELDRTRSLGRIRHLKVKAAHQLLIVLSLDANREAGLIGYDPRNAPSIYKFARETVVLWYRDLPVGTKHEPMASVQERQPTSKAEI